MTRRLHPLLFVGALLLVLAATSEAQPKGPSLGDDLPEPLDVQLTDYVLEGNKVYYLYSQPCAPILAADRHNPAADVTQIVGRTAVQGALPRTLYTFVYDSLCQSSQPDIRSNLASDAAFVYWLSAAQGGVVRLPEGAFAGTVPELISPRATTESEIVLVGDYIYLINHDPFGEGLFRIHKASGAANQLLTAAQVGPSPVDLRSDGEYLYWRVYVASAWVLKSYKLSSGVLSNIAGGDVLGYYPVAGTGVYIGFGSTMRRYSHADHTLSAPLYISDAPAHIISIAADATNIYFIQSQECSPACAAADGLYRLPLGSDTATLLYAAPTSSVQPLRRLQRSGDQLLLLQDNELVRLSTSAGSAPLTNLRITGMEVTQAVQSASQSVPLIRGKRTAVRLFASADGAAVSNVFALLYRTNEAGATIAGPLWPQNLLSAPGYLRVLPAPSREDINQSFLFFLPPDWTGDSNLRLRAELNPFHYPPEPTYADNLRVSPVLTLQPSGRLESQFILFEYESGGTRYRPRFREDVLQTFSWLRRAYPLASSPAWSDDPSPGLRPHLRYTFDRALGGNVDGTNRHPDCQRRINLPPDADGYLDDPSLCAAWYVVCPTLDTIRAAEGVPATVFLYGMVADNAGFPRGWACGGGTSGPSGSGTAGWDTDGSYADWYAGHEMGHALSRGHPVPGSAACGHSADDVLFPWPNAAIGDATIAGFDLGDPGLNSELKARVYPSSIWRDMMSYCSFQWISDYTYRGLLTNIPAAVATTARPIPAAGEYMGVSGVLFAKSHTAVVTQLRRWPSLANAPAA